jgi:predicted thioesterase
MASNLIGLRHQESTLVTTENAIDFLGVEDARVLATPYLIWNLEMACRNAVKPHLAPDQDTVGTVVNVKHLAATPLGMSVRFVAEVIAVEGRRVQFNVEAFDEKEKVSEGTHERFIVDIPRFAARVRAKASKR